MCAALCRCLVGSENRQAPKVAKVAVVLLRFFKRGRAQKSLPPGAGSRPLTAAATAVLRRLRVTTTCICPPPGSCVTLTSILGAASCHSPPCLYLFAPSPRTSRPLGQAASPASTLLASRHPLESALLTELLALDEDDARSRGEGALPAPAPLAAVPCSECPACATEPSSSSISPAPPLDLTGPITSPARCGVPRESVHSVSNRAWQPAYTQSAPLWPPLRHTPNYFVSPCSRTPRIRPTNTPSHCHAPMCATLRAPACSSPHRHPRHFCTPPVLHLDLQRPQLSMAAGPAVSSRSSLACQEGAHRLHPPHQPAHARCHRKLAAIATTTRPPRIHCRRVAASRQPSGPLQPLRLQPEPALLRPLPKGPWMYLAHDGRLARAHLAPASLRPRL